MTFDAAAVGSPSWNAGYAEGHAAGTATHVEHHRCERCYAAGVADERVQLQAAIALMQATIARYEAARERPDASDVA